MYKYIRYSFLFVAVSVNLMAADYPALPDIQPAEMSCKDLEKYNSDPYPLALEENKLYQSEFDKRCPKKADASQSDSHSYETEFSLPSLLVYSADISGAVCGVFVCLVIVTSLRNYIREQLGLPHN